MDSTSYAPLLDRLGVPQPSLQKFAVISIFQKLRSAPPYLNPDSDPGRNAITHCLNSNSPHILDQSVRELCRFVKHDTITLSRGLLELQSALEGCDSRFVDVFVKAIGFLVRLAFQKNESVWRVQSIDTHPFVKVLACRSEVQSELVQQLLLFILHIKTMGLDKVCDFFKPFLHFSILRIPFTDSSSSASFAKQLVSSTVSLCCTFPCEALPIIKLLTKCLKYFPCKNAKDLKDIIYLAEYLVDAYILILRQSVEAGLLPNQTQLFGVELLNTVLSFYTDFDKQWGGREPIVELSKRLLLAQKELGLHYIHELSSVLTSLFLILIQADLEHEQLSIMNISIYLLRWKIDCEYVVGNACAFSEGLLFIFPVISILSSPSGSVKAAATDFLSVLKLILQDLFVTRKKILNFQDELPSISKPEVIIHRLLQHLWFQGSSSPSNSYLLSFATDGVTINGLNDGMKSWVSQLREYCLTIVEKRKSLLISPRQESLVVEMPLLLCSLVAVLVMHDVLGGYAVDALATIGIMEPEVGLPLLLSILFYNKILCSNANRSQEILLRVLEMLPQLASQSAMVPLIIQSILPMLDKDAKLVLRATATRLLCKTWEATDRVFEMLQGILNPNAFKRFINEQDISISMAASVRDVCKKNPDRGVDLILSVSACIESRDPTIQALGFQSIAYLCEADVVDFYTAWSVIANHVLDYSVDSIVAQGLSVLLRWGAMDAEAYLDASKSVLQILWEIGTSRSSVHKTEWVKARISAFESLIQYEVEHIQESIPDFKRRNMEFLVSEDNTDVLGAVAEFEVKIITFEHTTRRRVLKEKRITVNKVEKMLDVFPRVIFLSGKSNTKARDLPGAALFCLSFTPKEIQNQGTPKDLPKLHAAYENALLEMAEYLQLSRNPLIALLSLQSWKPFMQRWMKAIIILLNSNVPSKSSDISTKAASHILKIMRKVAEESLPRFAENIALAIGALCLVLPSSAHAVTATASEFLLKWLFQFEHEYKQWSAAVTLGLISSYLHATDHKLKFQIITGLLEVACNSKSTLVKGACGVGLGFSCRNLLIRVEAPDVSNSVEISGVTEVNLLGRIVKTLSHILCKLSPSSSVSLQSLCKHFPAYSDDMLFGATSEPWDGDSNLEEDVWGVAGLILGLAESTKALYRAACHDAVITLKSLLVSWIPHLGPVLQSSHVSSTTPEILLSVGSCLALPAVVAFCLRAELVANDELNHIVSGYKELISELQSVNKSGTFHQSLLMASCIGAGNLLSCILDEGVYSMNVEDVKDLLEMFRKCYTDSYPPTVHFGGMLGVVNAFGAYAGTLTNSSPKPSSMQSAYKRKDSSCIRGPILSEPDCESLSISLMQEMFLAAQNSTSQQLQKFAAWAVSFLRHRLLSQEAQIDSTDSEIVSQAFPDESVVLQLSLWLMDLNYIEHGTTITHANTVAAVLRCLSRAPRLPSLEWGAIIRRCMRYEDLVSGKLSQDETLRKGILREECLKFMLAHANHVNPLLYFLDELAEVSRFRTLQLNLQSCLLCHLGKLIEIFSGSRLKTLFDDMVDYFSSSSTSYQVYNTDQKSSLRVSFWKGLYSCLSEPSTESPAYLPNMEKCMEMLFSFLPPLHFEATRKMDLLNDTAEWSEAVMCLGKVQQERLMDLLEVPETDIVQEGSHFAQAVKKIQARARLVKTGAIPLAELGKLKAFMLNTRSDGIWDALVEVVSALQHAEVSIKRQWLLDAVGISCITNYPTTALQFLGLLSSSCSKYMPFLVLDQVVVLSDLPVTLPSLLSDRSWIVIAEPVVLNLWKSTERVYNWARYLASPKDSDLNQHSINASESNMAVFLMQVMCNTCISLKDYLPLETQLRLANMSVT